MRIRSKSLGTPLALALATASFGTLPAAAPAQSGASAPVVQVATNRGKLVTLARPMADLFVANNEVADVQVRSPTQLYIFGKRAGETTISATSKSGAIVYSATVRVGNNFDSLGQMLSLAMPESRITATPMNGMVLLTGTVGAPDDAAEAERLVQAFVGKETVVLSRLKTATPLQVNLQVRFAEVSRTFVKNIGMNFSTVDQTGGFKFGISQGARTGGQFSPGGPLGVGFTTAPGGSSLITPGANTSTIGLAGKLLGLDILGALDLGERVGQVTSLANPNLTALSGETGTFLAGGEIPIPLAQGLGAVSVEYKQFGVSLAYTPTVLSDGRISLRVRPEVSQLDYSNAVTISGTSIPGLTTRRTETTVELGSGQSFMIAGLLSNNHNNSITKTPGAGDVPILGALFRSNAFQRNETELVIVITPYLVRPINSADVKLPTDGYRTPTDVQRVLLGTLAEGENGAQRPVPTMAPPAGAVPAIGAAAPVAPTAPLDNAASRDSADRRASGKKTKVAAAAPGFSQ